MKHTILLFLCFLPLIVVYIVMKLSLLFSASVSEAKYINQESKKPHGPYIPNPYDDDENDELD